MQNVDRQSNMSPVEDDINQITVNSPGNDVIASSDANDTAVNEEITVSEQPNPIENITKQVLSQNAAQLEVKNETPAPEFSPCDFQMEKQKLPKFSGDVREYAIFRSDFEHAIESTHAKRDAITLLRTCLKDKPLELIKGIGSDYDGAWEYLDSIYGDPRFVSDTITEDIVRFKALSDGEDARFCDLVHLIRWCYKTLKEVEIPSDMDNSHMLAIIEQKMCPNDRKVWSRDLERERKPATLINLIGWMTVEVKSRMRATAPVRSSASNRIVINSVHGEVQEFGENGHKCWVCSNSRHWPDQCENLAAMSVVRG